MLKRRNKSLKTQINEHINPLKSSVLYGTSLTKLSDHVKALQLLNYTGVKKYKSQTKCNFNTNLAPQDVFLCLSSGKTYGAQTPHRSGRHVNLLSFEGKERNNSRRVLTDANLEITAIIGIVIISSRKANGANNICHYG